MTAARRRPRSHRRDWIAEAATLFALTAAAAGAYLWTDAPLYNPKSTIDPWLYTALWTNLDQIYAVFHATYYVSRVPWIVPGYVLNELFDVRTAYFVLHTTYFFAGGLLFYALCRRYLGVVAAASGFVALIGSQMYYNAQRWDYQEGAVLTYMIAAYAFSLPVTRRAALRAASLASGGFFAAALVTTRILDIAYLVGLPLLYVAVTEGELGARLRAFGRDIAAFGAGALVLLAAGGWFSDRHGAEFFFFMPQWRVVRAGSGEQNQIPVDLWLPTAPYFWVPVFVIVVATAILLLGPRRDRVARRFLLATTVWLAVDFCAFALWQFAGTGWVFGLAYYFSSFLPPTLFCLTASYAALIGRPRLSVRSARLVALAAVATLAPVVMIYRTDSAANVAEGYGSTPYLIAFAAMVIAAVLVILARMPRMRAVSAAAAIALVLAASYAVDSSSGTAVDAQSDPDTVGMYLVGQDLIRYLHESGFAGIDIPYFWYDAAAAPGVYGSIQSLYYSGFTYIGLTMPTVDKDFRFRMGIWHPKKLVLLCVDASCDGGPRALRRAGYAPRLVGRRLLRHERVAVWVAIYRLKQPTA
jgi:hypothetical protein